MSIALTENRFVRNACAVVLGLLGLASTACSSSSGAGSAAPSDSGCPGSPTDATADTSPPPSLAQMTACDGPGQCTFAMIGCCGTCHPNGLDVLQAIRVGQEESFLGYTCHEALPVPGQCGVTGVACSCGRGAMPIAYVFASCVQNVCTGIDLRDGAWNECTTDADCELRTASYASIR
jgi:hypothetical protein